MEDRYYVGEQACTEDCRPLENLSAIADNAERTATLISAFIVRFRHGSGEPADSAAKLIPVPSGHEGQIARLRDAVDKLDKLARDLNTLG